MFTNLLIHTCDIESKTFDTVSYEQVEQWTTLASNVPCRKSTDNGASIRDGVKRQNTDDDLFFFDADALIERGDRILFNSEYYDVLKVEKRYDSQGVHHLEARSRIVDNA